MKNFLALVTKKPDVFLHKWVFPPGTSTLLYFTVLQVTQNEQFILHGNLQEKQSSCSSLRVQVVLGLKHFLDIFIPEISCIMFPPGYACEAILCERDLKPSQYCMHMHYKDKIELGKLFCLTKHCGLRQKFYNGTYFLTQHFYLFLSKTNVHLNPRKSLLVSSRQ